MRSHRQHPARRAPGHRGTAPLPRVRRRGPRPIVPVCGLLLTVALGAAGCAKNGTGGTGRPSPDDAGSGAPSPTVRPDNSASRTAAPATPAAGDRCHTGGLKIRTRAIGAAAGNHYIAIVFTNSSGRNCRVYGYPGMQLLTGDRATVQTKVVRDSSVEPALVTLQNGESAWARASWGTVPAAGENKRGGCQPDPASTEVTPPDETDHKVVTWSYGPVCQHGRITVRPLQPGAGPSR